MGRDWSASTHARQARTTARSTRVRAATRECARAVLARLARSTRDAVSYGFRTMHGALYVVACVALPAAWGVLMYHAFGAAERRRRRRSVQQSIERPPVDYSI
jgi:hypothetical protein